eukprot:CAMPEP_0198109062 /NCGR_PEP_ID=MMETSP1442-20131203/1082_1 /TAXON_ID= /ORGANISM="Craspedostauros australis, Strain CCMP3328" /LENGTH=65 /DNA_ID=CAMNT_0043764549 /DNA_START=472 /DNA_END=666 /DNA_ORIENTATION=+
MCSTMSPCKRLGEMNVNKRLYTDDKAKFPWVPPPVGGCGLESCMDVSWCGCGCGLDSRMGVIQSE